MSHPYLAGGPLALAHRGGGAAGQENTWRAFREAVALGYSYLETDAHCTADGRLVLFHDEDLDRVSDRRGRIRDLPYAEVAQARVGGSETIPLLADVLEEWPQVRLNVDLKSEAAVAPFVDIVNRAGAHDRVCVASFDAGRIARAAAGLTGRACLSAGRSTVTALRLASFVPGAPRPPFTQPVDVLQVPVRAGRVRVVTPAFVAAAHRWGLAVHCWTINDEAQMDELLDLGVDGIVSDATADLKRVLQRRGQW